MNKEEKLKLILSNEKLASRLSDSFSKEFESDDEKPSRRGRYMAKAILEKDFEGLLIAICGWSSDSLINMAIYDDPYPEEKTTPRVITREMVAQCYKNKKITLAVDPENKEWIGVACEIASKGMAEYVEKMKALRQNAIYTQTSTSRCEL